MSGRVCLCAGSFDPVTLGHVDIIRRASALFDRVHAAVLINESKTAPFTPEERADMLRAVTGGMENVSVGVWRGALLDYARQIGACAIVRGLRGPADLDYEAGWAQVNGVLAPDIETVFLVTKPEYSHISSTHVRVCAGLGFDISPFVPAEICGIVSQRLGKRTAGA